MGMMNKIMCKRYSVTGHGNFFGIEKDGKIITGYFDSYERDDLHKIVDELNNQEELINELLYQFGELGYNNKSCKNCISYSENINYCTMYDMEVKEEDIVVRCEEREEL